MDRKELKQSMTAAHHHPHHDDDPEHSHSHSHGGRGHSHAPKDFGRAFAIGIALNVGFVLVEAAYGFMANSMALLADAGHNLSDVLGLVIAWIAAMRWYLKAAWQGAPDAQFALGKMYMKGEGVPADPVRAQMWFNLAASSKSPPDGAVDLRNESAASLPPPQRLRAEELEHQCYLTNYVTCE